MAKAPAVKSKEDIAAENAALKLAITNFKEGVKGLKKFRFELDGGFDGKGTLLVMNGENILAKIGVKI